MYVCTYTISCRGERERERERVENGEGISVSFILQDGMKPS